MRPQNTPGPAPSGLFGWFPGPASIWRRTHGNLSQSECVGRTVVCPAAGVGLAPDRISAEPPLQRRWAASDARPPSRWSMGGSGGRRPVSASQTAQDEIQLGVQVGVLPVNLGVQRGDVVRVAVKPPPDLGRGHAGQSGPLPSWVNPPTSAAAAPLVSLLLRPAQLQFKGQLDVDAIFDPPPCPLVETQAVGDERPRSTFYWDRPWLKVRRHGRIPY